MLNKFTLILFLYSGAFFAQEVSIEKNCDTASFYLLSTETYLVENASCRMSGPAKILYFTTYKEFSDYYNNNKFPLNASCLSQFNNFNFKEYNMVLVNYNSEKSTTKHIDVDIRHEKNKYHLLIKHYWNKNDASLMIPEHFDKCISLPKEKSISKPIIYTCNIQ